MNAATFILTAVGGGFFGVLLAGMLLFIFVRGYLRAQFGPTGVIGKLAEEAHQKNECPICKRPMRHDHRGDEA